MDIFITSDNFQTLMDIVITDSTRIDMMQQALTTIAHATMMVIQEKT
jgi:hypothetical protein